MLSDKDIIELWNKQDIIFRLNSQNRQFNGENYQLRHIDGPPFVSGNPHLGHCAIGYLKSCILNFNMSILGKQSKWRLGWDTHGVPIESVIVKEINSNKLDNKNINDITLEEFNEMCKKMIIKCSNSWKPIYDKLGRWGDFKNAYKTMDKKYMESVWWCFKQIYEKNLVNFGAKIVPYSYGCETPYSNFEANENYKTVNCKSVYIKFKLIENLLTNINNRNITNTYIIAWTTTPWTLPMNMALCVNKSLLYDIWINNETNEIYIVGDNTINNTGLNKEQFTFYKKVNGKKLINKKYYPLYNSFIDDENSNKFYKIVGDDYVKKCDKSGTDIVHLAPAFGEDDYRVCIRENMVNSNNIINYTLINKSCKYLDIDNVEEFMKNRLVFDVNDNIIKDLKNNKNVLLKQQNISHNYPYCYRTDTPLIYVAMNNIYIKTTEIKDRMIELNKSINWYPKNIGEGRFNNWLENVQDWCVSRTRNFGNPIPLWVNEDDAQDIICIGSIEELCNLSGLKQKNIQDLHPEYINKIVLNINNKIYKRVPFIFDCWFESGCVPYAQLHYPFENNNIFDNEQYLTDYISEGLDQTRGWFYTLLVLSTIISNKAPSKNILCVGLILDDKGNKFSKKNKNYVDSAKLIDKYGSDVLRLYLLGSQLMSGDSLKFNAQVLEKQIYPKINQLMNAVKFFKEHELGRNDKVDVNIDNCNKTVDILDIWIISKINNLYDTIKKLMINYDVRQCVKLILDFIDELTNWYIKLNRDRIKGNNGRDDRIISLSVLYYVLIKYIKISSSFMPFTCEKIFNEIRGKYFPSKSIFLLRHKLDININDDNISNKIKEMQLIIKLIREIRQRNNISLKRPLKECKIYIKNSIDDNIKYYINNGVNCDKIIYSNEKMKYDIVPVMSVLGKKHRGNIKNVLQEFKKLTYDDVLNNDLGMFEPEDFNIVIKVNSDISQDNIKLLADTDNGILCSVDIDYDENIHDKFILNKLIVFIQRMRRDSKLTQRNIMNLYVNEENNYYINLLKNNKEIKQRIIIRDVIDNIKVSEDKIYFHRTFTYTTYNNDKTKNLQIALLHR